MECAGEFDAGLKLVSLLHSRSSGEQTMKEMIERFRYRERGAAGYMLLWFMGVPASVLFLIFLLRGCN